MIQTNVTKYEYSKTNYLLTRLRSNVDPTLLGVLRMDKDKINNNQHLG